MSNYLENSYYGLLIVQYLRDHGHTTPETAIKPSALGRAFWDRERLVNPYATRTPWNSAWASPKLMRLEAQGIVAATSDRRYYLKRKEATPGE